MAGERFSGKDKRDLHRRAAMLVFDSDFDIRAVATLRSQLREEFGDDLYEAAAADVDTIDKIVPFPTPPRPRDYTCAHNLFPNQFCRYCDGNEPEAPAS